MYKATQLFSTQPQQSINWLLWLVIASGLLIVFFIVILEIIALWKVFVKAGQPGWAVLIPFYNLYVMLEIIGLEWWWLLLMLIPPVNVFLNFVIQYELAKSFGKRTEFALGLFLAPFIFLPILGFGRVKYVGPSAARKFTR
jgi:hypothetical protein